MLLPPQFVKRSQRPTLEANCNEENPEDVEPHVLRFVDISPDDPTDLPNTGWCRIEGDMWYCYSEPRLENGKTIHLRFVTKNTPSSANGNSQFSEDGTKWLPLSDDSWTKVR